LTLAAVRSLREPRAPATEEELADLELDVLAGFVLARHSAGLADSTIRGDTNHLESRARIELSQLGSGVSRVGCRV